MGEPVRYDAADGVATIVMDDGKVNVMSGEMQAALHGALDRAEADGAVVLLTGRDGVFSAGFDLQVLAAGGGPATEMVIGGFELSLRLRSFPAPVVVACTGHAIAMGAFLLLSGDHRLGAEGPFRLVANEVSLGIAVPHAAIEILRQRLTPSVFDRAATLAETFSPDTAVAAGFLDRVVAPDELLGAAHDTASGFAALDRAAHAETKRRARAGALEALREAIDLDRTAVPRALS